MFLANLKIDNFILKKILFLGSTLFFLIILFSFNPSVAQAVDSNCISAGSGNWTDITWTNCTGNTNGDPDSDDTVTISDGHQVTLNTTTSIANLVICDTSCTVNVGGTDTLLTHSSGTLTVSGNVTVYGGANANISTSWSIGVQTVTINGLLKLDPQASNSGRDARINLTAGTLNLNGGLTFDLTSPTSGTEDNQVITCTSSCNINLKGTWTNPTAGDLVFGDGTFCYCDTAAAQTIVADGSAPTYNNLKIGNTHSSGATTGVALTSTQAVGGTLIVDASAKLNVAGFNLTVTGATTVNGTLAHTSTTGAKVFTGAVTVASGGSWTNTVNEQIDFAGGFANNSGGTVDMGTGVQTFTSSQNVSGNSSITFSTIGINAGVTVTNTNTATVTVSGNLIGSDSASTWTQGANSTLVIAGALLSTGTLSASVNRPNTIEYSGNAQTIKTPSNGYSNLKISGTNSTSVTQSILNTLNVTGTFTPSGGTITMFGPDGAISNSGTLTFQNLTTNCSSNSVTANTSFTIAGTFTNGSTCTFSPTSGTITMNNGSAITNSGTTLAFNNLTLANSATITANTSYTVKGTLTVGTSANLSPSSGTVTVNGGGTISNSGTLDFFNLTTSCSSTSVTANTSFSISGALTNGSTCTLAPNTGTITMDANSSISNSGTLTFNNLTVAGTGVTASGNFTVAGNFLVNSASGFTSTSGNLSIGGNFTNTPGTTTGFAHNNGTVIFTGAVSHTISGTTTFHHLTNTTAGSSLLFVAGTTFTFNGTFTVQGTDTNNRITINSSNDTTQWLADFVNEQADGNVAYVNLRNSGCSSSAAVNMNSTNSNVTNNDTACWIFGITVDVSGNVYADESGTPAVWSSCNHTTPTNNIAISINGGAKTNGFCNSSTGAFSFTGLSANANQVATLFMDTNGGDRAVLYTKFSGTPGNISGIKLVKNRISIRSEDGSFTNANINVFDQDNDSDIPVRSDGTNVTASSSAKLLIESGETFAPGGNVSVDAMEVLGTYSGSTETLNLTNAGTGTNCIFDAGTIMPLCINGGTFTAPTYTRFNGTSATKIADTSYVNLGVATTSDSTAVTYTLNGNTTVSGTVTIGNASDSATKDTLDLNSSTLTLSAGSGATPLSITAGGQLSITNSVVQYTGSSANVTATTYSTLALGGTGTYTLPASDITLRSGLSIASGASVTKSSNNSIIFARGGGATQSLIDNNNGSSDLGLVQVSANSGNTTLNLATSAKFTKLTIDDSQTFSTNGANTLTLTSASSPLVIGSSATFTASSGSTVVFTGNGASTIPATTYHHLQLKPSGSSQQVLGTGTFTINGDLTVGDTSNQGATAATNDPVINVTGNTTIASGATLTMGDGAATFNGNLTVNGNWDSNGVSTRTFTVNGNLTGSGSITTGFGTTVNHRVSSGKTFGSTSGSNMWQFYKLLFSNSNAGATPVTITTETGGTGQIRASNLLTIGSVSDATGATTTLDATNRDWVLPAQGTSFVITTDKGVLSANTSTFNYADENCGCGGSIDITPATYYNLKAGNTSDNYSSSTFTISGNTIVGGTLTIGNSGSTNPDTFSTSGSNYSLTANNVAVNDKGIFNGNNSAVSIPGNLTINTGGSFTAPGSSGSLSIGDNFSNSGTFTHNSGTVNLNDASKVSSVSGNINFHNLTINTPLKWVEFENNKTFGIAGTFTVAGSDGNLVTLRSNSSGNRWLLNLTGSANVNQANIKDAGCAEGTNTVDTTSSEAIVNAGNNGPCWLFTSVFRPGGGHGNYGTIPGQESGSGPQQSGGGQSGGSQGQGGSTGEGSGSGGQQQGGGSGGGGGGDLGWYYNWKSVIFASSNFTPSDSLASSVFSFYLR